MTCRFGIVDSPVKLARRLDHHSWNSANRGGTSPMANWNPRANELFLRAFEIGPADERQAFLDVECGQDTDLRREVDSLLKAGANLGDFMNQPLLPLSLHPS